MAQVPDIVNKTAAEAEDLLALNSLVGYATKPQGTVELASDKVRWQDPDSTVGTVPDGSQVKYYTTAINAPTAQVPPPVASTEHYIVRGREPVMLGLSVDAKVPVLLEITATRNLTIRVSKAVNVEVSSAQPGQRGVAPKPLAAPAKHVEAGGGI